MSAITVLASTLADDGSVTVDIGSATTLRLNVHCGYGAPANLAGTSCNLYTGASSSGPWHRNAGWVTADGPGVFRFSAGGLDQFVMFKWSTAKRGSSPGLTISVEGDAS